MVVQALGEDHEVVRTLENVCRLNNGLRVCELLDDKLSDCSDISRLQSTILNGKPI